MFFRCKASFIEVLLFVDYKMNKYLFILLLSFIFNQHFNVEIDETGESTLFIFSDEISNLSNGDEIGIFDENAIIDTEGNTGPLLVGSGVWNSSQLEIVTIGGLVSRFCVFSSDFLSKLTVGSSSTIGVCPNSFTIYSAVSLSIE